MCCMISRVMLDSLSSNVVRISGGNKQSYISNSMEYETLPTAEDKFYAVL
jgi:hypothetical protein